MYSILIPLKTPYIINIVSGAVGGAVMGALGTKIWTFGGSGIFGFANYVNPTGDLSDLIKSVIGIGIDMVFCFIVQWITYDFEAEKKL